MLAHFSGDEALARRSPRTRTFTPAWPARCIGVPLDQVTSQLRRVAKAVNFGVIYGQSPFGLAKMLDIEQDEAAQFHRRLLRRLSGRRASSSARFSGSAARKVT